MYKKEDLAFILYNNRSVDGVVSNFLPAMKLDPFKLNELESQLEWCSRSFHEGRTVEIPAGDLVLDCEDVRVTPGQVSSFTELVLGAHANLKGPELEWLLARGLTHEIIERWKLGSLSHVKDPKALEALGVSRHPMLASLFDDDTNGGGILIPLFNGGTLVNCTTRRISDVGKLKYSQACPDVDVWGLDSNFTRYGESRHVWVTEGLFDMMAIRSTMNDAVSVSSAMWSGPQLYQLMDSAESIDIFADNDQVGLRSAAILRKFLRMRGYRTEVYVSRKAKDPAEHFLQMGLGWDDVERINVTRDMIDSKGDMTFNFTKYLKNRTF